MAKTIVDEELSTPRTPVHGGGKVWITVKKPSKAQQERSNSASLLSKLSKVERRSNDSSTIGSSTTSHTIRTTGTGTSFASEGASIALTTTPTGNKSILGEDRNDWDWFDDTPSKSNSNRMIVNNVGNNKDLSIDLLQNIHNQLNELQKTIKLEQILPLLNEQLAKTTGASKGGVSLKSTIGKRDIRDKTALSRHSTSGVSKGDTSRKSTRGKRDIRDKTALSRHSTSGVSMGDTSRKGTKGKRDIRDQTALSRHSTSSKRYEGDKRVRRRSSHGSNRSRSEEKAHNGEEGQPGSSISSSGKGQRRSSVSREGRRRSSGSGRKPADTDTIPPSPVATASEQHIGGGGNLSYSWWDVDAKSSVHKCSSGILRESLHGDSHHGDKTISASKSSSKSAPKPRRSSTPNKKKRSAKSKEDRHRRSKNKSRDRSDRKQERKKRSSFTSNSSNKTAVAAAAAVAANPGKSIWTQFQHSPQSCRMRRCELSSSSHKHKTSRRDSTKTARRRRSKSKNRSIDDQWPRRERSASDLLLTKQQSPSTMERSKQQQQQQAQGPLQRLEQAMMVVEDKHICVEEDVRMNGYRLIGAENATFDFEFESDFDMNLDFAPFEPFEPFELVPHIPLNLKCMRHA